MGPHAKAAGEGGEVDGRIYEIRPDKALSAVEQLQPLLDDAVAFMAAWSVGKCDPCSTV